MTSALTPIEQLFGQVGYYSEALLERKKELEGLSLEEKMTKFREEIHPLIEGYEAIKVQAQDIGEIPEGLYAILLTTDVCVDDITAELVTAQSVHAACASRAPLNHSTQPVRALQNEQNEHFEVSQFCDRYQMLLRDLSPDDHMENFESISAFYMSLQGKTYSSAVAIKQFSQLVESIQKALDGCVKAQRGVETGVGIAHAEHTALLNLHTALEQNEPELIDEAFKALTDEQREAVRELLGKKLERTIAGSMFNFGFSKWPGKQNQNEVQKATVAELLTRSPSNTNVQNDELLADRMAAQLSLLLLSQEAEPVVNSRLEGIQNALRELQGLAKKENFSLDDLGWHFSALNSLDVNCCFKLCNLEEEKPTNFANRLSFHLFHVHQMEKWPHLKDGDMEYGKKAFLELEEGYCATYEQRIRVIQRTIAEVTLAGLEEAINNDDMEWTQKFVDALHLALHPDDAVHEANNVAYRSFGLLYALYNTAYEQDTSIIDPNDERFGNDFGRNGFAHPDINPNFKKMAIYELLKEMKSKWEILPDPK